MPFIVIFLDISMFSCFIFFVYLFFYRDQMPHWYTSCWLKHSHETSTWYNEKSNTLEKTGLYYVSRM